MSRKHCCSSAAILVALSLAPVPVAAMTAGGLLANGDFALPLDSGWTASNRDLVGYHALAPMEDGGVQVRKVQCGYARLSQEVAVEDVALALSARLKLRASAETPGYYAYGALALEYLGPDGAALADTRYLLLAGDAPVPDGGAHHVIPVPGDTWVDIDTDLAAELRDNLPGVDAGRVSAIRVVLESFGSGTSAC